MNKILTAKRGINPMVPETPQIARVMRRRDDARRLLDVDEEAAAQTRMGDERRARVSAGWSALGRDVKLGGPAWANPGPDALRHAELETSMRARGNGTLDIVQLTNEEAVTLGLRKPTLHMRMTSAWRMLMRGPM